MGGNANAESPRRCHRRDQILLLHIPPPIRPRSTIPRISSPSTLLRSRGWSNDDGPRHGVRSIATVLWTGVEGAMAAAVSVILPSPRTIPTAGEEARGDEVRAREEGSTTRGATEPLAAAHHRGDRADPISVCPRTLGSCLPDRALGRIPRRRPRRGCGANDGDDHGGDECDASFGAHRRSW